jgi:DNA-binding response OmpR family regulator
MAIDYEFGPFSLDVERLQLFKHGQPVRIEPKAFRVLAFLLKNHRRALTKEGLFEEFWPEHGDHDGNLKAVNVSLNTGL